MYPVWTNEEFAEFLKIVNCAGHYASIARKRSIISNAIQDGERKINLGATSQARDIAKFIMTKDGSAVPFSRALAHLKSAMSRGAKDNKLTDAEYELRYGELKNYLAIAMTGTGNFSERLTDDDVMNKTAMPTYIEPGLEDVFDTAAAPKPDAAKKKSTILEEPPQTNPPTILDDSTVARERLLEAVKNGGNSASRTRKWELMLNDIARERTESLHSFKEWARDIIDIVKEMHGPDVDVPVALNAAKAALITMAKDEKLDEEEYKLRWGELKNRIMILMTGGCDHSELFTDTEVRDKTLMPVYTEPCAISAPPATGG